MDLPERRRPRLLLGDADLLDPAAHRQRLGHRVPTWSPEDLPEAPRRRTIGLSELVWGVGVVAVSLGWLAWQHHRSPIQGIAMLDPGLWSSGWLWGLVALLLAALVVEIVKYAVGTWTLTVTVMSVLVDLVLGGYLVAMATTQRLVNPELLALASDPAATETLVQSVVVLSVVVVTAIGVGDAVVHHGRDRRDAGLATVAG